MTDPKLKTIAIQPRTAAALAWVLREEIDISKDRLDGLKPADARNELDDIAALRALLAEIAGPQPDGPIAAHLRSIDKDLAAMRESIAPADPRGAMEAEAIGAYSAVAGQIVLCSEVECYDARSDSVTALCDPPAVLRIHRYGSEQRMRESILNWTDNDHLDPHLDIEVLEPHPAFAGLRPSWVYGTCRSADGGVEPAPFRLADEATRIVYADAKGLAEDEVAPPAGLTP